MSFYNKLSYYYDLLFPVEMDRIEFVDKLINKKNSDLIDIASGSGGYSIEFAKRGYNVTSLDSDENMINLVKEKASSQNLNIKTFVKDMLDVDSLSNEKFDIAFCIGNSIVHLRNLNEINLFIRKVKNILNKGHVIIQIINFDRILNKKIDYLPTLKNTDENITFKRYYEPFQDNIKFKTIININDIEYENEILLYPLRYEEVIKALKENGFKKIEVFSDFEKNPFIIDESLMIVISADF
jgi:2-polyprenyl-3-methyl-5-hydroxy-6-metoxy-1,4-benzoquinol methylase